MSVVLVVEDVHVSYRVYQERRMGLKQYVANGFRGRDVRVIDAVRGVSFTMREGESLGIVGPNGAGKTTLLTAIAGLLPVNSGRIRARSTPSFLGVRPALKNTLSGARNIYLGCLALGMPKTEIDERFDDIVDFTGLRDSIDLPLKAYSSGMRARLQFAIATSVTPDILLVDEALAVGDRAFRRKSNERIEEIRAASGAVVLVSHTLSEIEKSCDRVVWIDEGKVQADGSAGEVLRAYEAAQDASA
jgi:teichoic acid transport system ATP-binding protein